MGALVAYVDAETRIAIDGAACRDDLQSRRTSVPVDTAMCIAGFAQTLREDADAIVSAADTHGRSDPACERSRAQLARSARVLSDDWQRVVDDIRGSALADTWPSAPALRLSIQAAVTQSDLLVAPDLHAYRKACLVGAEARSAEDLPERHREANRSAGQTI